MRAILLHPAPVAISYATPSFELKFSTAQGRPVYVSAARRAAVAITKFVFFMAFSLGGGARLPPCRSGVVLRGLGGLLGGGELLGRVSGGLGFFPNARFPLHGRDELVERFLVHCHEDLASGGGQFL